MSPAMVANCEASNGADSGDAGTPCPPVKRSVPLWWEDNTFHQVCWAKVRVGAGSELGLGCSITAASPLHLLRTHGTQLCT